MSNNSNQFDSPSREETDSGAPRSTRIDGFERLELTPGRVESRRLAAAIREIITHLVRTSAEVEQITEAADELEALARQFSEFPAGAAYEGFAEAANAGAAMAIDPERLAFFDHSPLIGLANPLSPPLSMRHDPDNADQILGHVTFGPAYEGPPGFVHGGYVAAIFDELLGATQSLSGTQGMTAHLDVDYKSPTPMGERLEMRGWLKSRDGRKIWASAELRHGDRICVTAQALFVAFREGGFAHLLEQRDT